MDDTTKLSLAREWAREAGYALVPKDRVRDYAVECSIHRDTTDRFLGVAGRLEGFLVAECRERTRKLAEALRLAGAFEETERQPGHGFRSFRSTVRVVMPRAVN